MPVHDCLGFGTQVNLDGAKAALSALSDENLSRDIIASLLSLIEGAGLSVAPGEIVVLKDGEDGHSAALVRGETSVSLHTFPGLRSVTLQSFSVRDLPLHRTTEIFLDAYQVGRFQSTVRSHGLLLPREPEGLAKALAGAREYARLRVSPPERVTL